MCLRVGSAQEVSWGLGGFLHELKPREERAVELNLVPPGPARKAHPKILDSVYRALLGEHLLSEAHGQHLRDERKLSGQAIVERGYKSWGLFPLQRAPMARAVYERLGNVTLDVPGVIVRKQKGPEYVTLAGAPGIAIPVRNVKGRIVGMQIRVDRPGAGKYLWLSSASQGGASPGTPVHVARPRDRREGSGRVWLTEGPLKADIACERLSEIVLALPGVNALGNFVPTVEELVQRGELKELVVALDSDWRDKPAVAKARNLVAERAARAGVTVWLARWVSEHKGLDDLLLAGGRPTLEPYLVQGNGPRLLEDAQALAPRVWGPALPLEEARKVQQGALKTFLWDHRQKGEARRERGILLRSLPGVGKSQALTDTLNDVLQKRSVRALVFVPRHDLSQGSGRETWEVVRGRTHTSSTLPEPPCQYGAVQAHLSSLRIPGQLGCDYCPALELCRDLQQAQGKPFYHAQFEKKAPITVHPLQHFLLPSLLREAAIVALDDCDLRSLCIEDVKLSRTNLEHALYWAQRHPDHSYAHAEGLLELLVEMVRLVPVGDFRWQEVEFFEVLEDLARRHSWDLETVLELAEKAQEPDPFGDGNLILARLDVPVRFVRELLEVLWQELEHYKSRRDREWEGWNCRLRLERKAAGGDVELRLKLRRDLPLKALKGKDLVVVDASLTLDEARQLFPEREWSVIDPYVEMPATVEIFQYPDQAWGKQRLQDERARQQALEAIGKMVERHPGESIALITHKGFTGDVKRRFPQLIVGHFFGQRGSNVFKDCDVEIVFGTPYPNPDELQQLAEALYWDDKPVLRQVFLEKRTFETSGQAPRQVAVRCYADPRLRELQRSKCEEELLQSIYRIRPLSVESPVEETGQGLLDLGVGPRKRATVYLFSSMPLPGLSVQLIEQQRPPAPVANLRPAAVEIALRGERITEQRLAQEARSSRYLARRFKNEEPMRSSLGAVGPPPAHGPPLALPG